MIQMSAVVHGNGELKPSDMMRYGSPQNHGTVLRQIVVVVLSIKAELTVQLDILK